MQSFSKNILKNYCMYFFFLILRFRTKALPKREFEGNLDFEVEKVVFLHIASISGIRRLLAFLC